MRDMRICHRLARIIASAAMAFVAVLLAVMLCTCGKAAESPAIPSTSDETASRRIIIDTDTGADDASAIILAATCPDVEIVGVTVLVGNVDLDQATKNALMALEVAGLDAPVYQGSVETYEGEVRQSFSVFGADGMGDQGLVHPSGQAEEGDAIDFILDTVRANPDEIEIVSIGPATNVAKAIARDPETMSHVKMVWSMATSGLGPGNATPVAEFNVYHDAPAFKALANSGIPVTVIGLDMTDGDAHWSVEDFETLEKTNDAGAFVAKSFSKLLEYYQRTDRGDVASNCDAVAMMCALYPDFVNATKRCDLSCITDPGETYAQVIFYQEGLTYDTEDDIVSSLVYDVTLVTDCDKADFFDRYLEAIATLD